MSAPVNQAPLLPEPSLPGSGTTVTVPAGPAAFPTDDAPLPSLPSLPSLPADPPTPTDGSAGQPTLDEPGRTAAHDSTLDGQLPRLGAGVPAPPQQTAPVAPAMPGNLELPSLPSLPTASPVLASASGIPAPDAEPATTTGDDPQAPDDNETGPVHPMAHLMPERAAPSEASRKAAEIRAAKKAKAKKIKLAVTAGALVVSVVVGPPLFSWLSNAINDAGSLEQPAE